MIRVERRDTDGANLRLKDELATRRLPPARRVPVLNRAALGFGWTYRLPCPGDPLRRTSSSVAGTLASCLLIVSSNMDICKENVQCLLITWLLNQTIRTLIG